MRHSRGEDGGYDPSSISGLKAHVLSHSVYYSDVRCIRSTCVCRLLDLSPRAWIAVGFLSAICTFGAYLAYANGVQRLAPSRAATVATLEPVVALGVAFVVWGDQLRPLGLLGAAMVLAGVIWAAQLAPRPGAEEIHP